MHVIGGFLQSQSHIMAVPSTEINYSGGLVVSLTEIDIPVIVHESERQLRTLVPAHFK